MPLIGVATAILAASLAQVEPAAPSWTEAPEAAQERTAPPAPAREAVPPADALAAGATQIREGAVALGAWGAQRYGIGLAGGVLHVATASEATGGAAEGKLLELAFDLTGGRTGTGLEAGDAQVSVTMWSSPRRALRGGAGVDAGLVGYRRATTGGWEVGTSAGAHLAFHGDLLRARDRAGFVEVRAGVRALARGAELSAVALVGLAFRTETIFVRRERRGPEEPGDPPPSSGDPWSSP